MDEASKPNVTAVGPAGSFAHAAARKYFGEDVEMMMEDSIDQVFISVFKEKAENGVVLMENCFGETARRTLDLLVGYGLKVSAEVVVRPSLHLMTRTKRTRVKRIYVTPDDESLCRGFLEREMPDIGIQRVLKTSIAAELASRKRACAAVAGELASEIYGLEIRYRNIQDQPDLPVRFLVIGQKDAPPSGNDKTMIFFSLMDRPGIVYEVMEPLRVRGINVTRIESRPAHKSNWDQYLFLEIAGHRSRPDIAEALEEVSSFVEFISVLGSYPAAQPVDA